MAMSDLLPFKSFVQSIFTGLGCIEENAGALAYLVQKHCAVKYHWFRSCLKPENFRVLKVLVQTAN